MRKHAAVLLSCLGMAGWSTAPAQDPVFPGADEGTRSRSESFTWINNTNEGATEAQTLTNLDSFEWLQDEYGMVLDICAFDAGAIDGKRLYGNRHRGVLDQHDDGAASSS